MQARVEYLHIHFLHFVFPFRFVIPAQAGIQLIKKSPRKWDNIKLGPLCGVFILLDSGLRRNDGQ